MKNSQRLATIDDILKGVPQFKCIEGCHDCCGPVPMSRLEWNRIAGRTGIKTQFDEHLDCVLFKDGKCSVYDIRPAICHIFGASEAGRLICPHGKKPEVNMSKAETDAMNSKIAELGHGYVLNSKTFTPEDAVRVVSGDHSGLT